MKLTNNHNLPGPIYSKVAGEMRERPPGYGLTTLLRPPRMVALEIKHWGEIESDAMDHVWRLFGSAIHQMIDVDNEQTILREHLLEADIAGVKVRTAIDRLWKDGPANVLTEFKTTSVWSVIYGKPEWEQQLNLQGAMLHLNGRVADRMEVVALLRDWSARDAQYDSQKPQSPVVKIDVNRWLPDRQLNFLVDRVEAHKLARSSEVLPECSDADRWTKPDTWAVMKAGRKSALRVLPSNAEAETWGQNNAGGKFTIEHRPGENVRCERYCPVSQFCDQFKQLKEAA